MTVTSQTVERYSIEDALDTLIALCNEVCGKKQAGLKAHASENKLFGDFANFHIW